MTVQLRAKLLHFAWVFLFGGITGAMVVVWSWIHKLKQHSGELLSVITAHDDTDIRQAYLFWENISKYNPKCFKIDIPGK